MRFRMIVRDLRFYIECMPNIKSLKQFYRDYYTKRKKFKVKFKDMYKERMASLSLKNDK